MTADSHRIIAALIDAGAENYKIHENVYDNFSFNRMKMVGYCLYNKLTVVPEYNTAYISLSKEERKQFNSEIGDTEGVVNMALEIKNIKFAAFFYENDKEVKISLRSKGTFNVKDVAQKYFEGGGHRNASGGKSNTSVEETVNKFLSILPAYEKELSK